MKYFPDKDEQWHQVADVVANAIGKQQCITLAPADFIPEFPRVVAYSLLSRFRPDFFDVVVVHKGLCEELGGLNLEYWQANYGVVFANAVFVVFVKDQESTIDVDSNDVVSLFSRIASLPDLPIQPFTPDQDQDYILGDDDIDLSSAIKFLEKDGAQHHLICGPLQLRPIFKHLIDPQEILKTTIGSCDFIVLTINSVISFPYKDLLDVCQNCVPVYGDVASCVFKRRASHQPSISSGLAAAVMSAMQHQDYLIELNRYRTTVSGKAA